jgi:hypothetical protein
MIDAKELRIGNLIYDAFDDVLPVDYIYKDVIGLLNGAGGTDKYQDNPIISGDINDLKPIPLTEEWLTKFGFEYDKENELYFKKPPGENRSDFILFDYEFYFDWCNTELKHVHRLQNLWFERYNEELSIK